MNLQEVEEYLEGLANDVAEGMADPMEVYATIQSIRKKCDPLEKSIKEEAIEKATEYGADKGPVSYKGFVFSFKNGRRLPQFNENAAWLTANKEQKEIEKLAKLAEELGQPTLNPKTGEFIDPVRYTYSAGGLSVSKG
jgi:hypothetical protein